MSTTKPTPTRSAPAHPDDEEKLTVPEVCRELKISRSTFYYWRQTGKAPQCVVLPNNQIRIKRSVFDQWLADHSEVA